MLSPYKNAIQKGEIRRRKRLEAKLDEIHKTHGRPNRNFKKQTPNLNDKDVKKYIKLYPPPANLPSRFTDSLGNHGGTHLTLHNNDPTKKKFLEVFNVDSEEEEIDNEKRGSS